MYIYAHSPKIVTIPQGLPCRVRFVGNPRQPLAQGTWPSDYPVIKDVPGGIPKSHLLGVTVALIHVAGQ